MRPIKKKRVAWNKGLPAWNRGLKMKYPNRKRPAPGLKRKRISPSWNKGKTGLYKTSEETKERMRIAMKGRVFTDEWKKKLSIKAVGNKNAPRGEKNHLWQGGKSFEKYPVDWNNTLRQSIRERDHYTCKICGEKQGDYAYSVHHIDYDKKNCNPDNLITLCKRCHQNTNQNRSYWIGYFKTIWK